MRGTSSTTQPWGATAFARSPVARFGLRPVARFGVALGALLAVLAGSLHPAAGSSADAGTAPESARLRPAVQSGEILGFDLEEERHYALGPPDALQRGESAVWSIRLQAVQGSGRELRATFTLQHRREAPRSLDSPWSSGQVTHAQVDATLIVNAYGAPLELTYTSQRHIYDVGDELFQVEYTYEGGRYEKRVSLQGVEWDMDIELIEHANLDAQVPIGLFAFAPQALGCMEWLVGTVIQHRTGTGDISPRGPVQSADRQGRATVEGAALASGVCYEDNTDPAFANPGLVSLAMPLLWERRGDSELVLFSPLRPDLVRGQRMGVPVTFGPIIPTGAMGPGSNPLSGMIPGLDFKALFGAGGTDGDKERAKNPARYFFPRRMKLSDRQRIEVGARKMEALPMEIAGFAGTVWVDDWGKVVRFDIPPLRYGDALRWVRLLHESEY